MVGVARRWQIRGDASCVRHHCWGCGLCRRRRSGARCACRTPHERSFRPAARRRRLPRLDRVHRNSIVARPHRGACGRGRSALVSSRVRREPDKSQGRTFLSCVPATVPGYGYQPAAPAPHVGRASSDGWARRSPVRRLGRRSVPRLRVPKPQDHASVDTDFCSSLRSPGDSCSRRCRDANFLIATPLPHPATRSDTVNLSPATMPFRGRDRDARQSHGGSSAPRNYGRQYVRDGEHNKLLYAFVGGRRPVASSTPAIARVALTVASGPPA